MFDNINSVELVLRLPALLIGIGLHEYAHAWAAVRQGDSLPEREGRLSLNPIDHLDPMGTILIIFAGFGWGKAVNVNIRSFVNPVMDHVRVSLAGPMTNLVLCALSCLAMALVKPSLAMHTDSGYRLYLALYHLIYLNGLLALFNLIPLHPLDGGTVLRAYGSRKMIETVQKAERSGFGMMVIVLLFVVGAQYIFTPVVWALEYFSSGIWPAVGFFLLVTIAWGAFLQSFPKKLPRR